ncbi:MAG: ABC transporter permease [Thermomicrobiales bacterium]
MSEASLKPALITLERASSEPTPRLQRFSRTMRHHPDLLIGSIIATSVILVALFAPWLAKEELTAANLTSRLMPPFWLEGGLEGSLLGTDQLGRDLFTRIIYGARTSLTVAFVSVFFTAIIGVLIGTFSGYFGGMIDTLLMRFVDLFLAFPGIILTIIVLSVLGSGVRNIILVLAVTQWVGYARLTRGMTLSLKHREFIESARASGAGSTRIILRHILPNCMTPIGVLASLQVAGMILIEASLSFLGFGVQPPTPSWGIMVAEGRQYLDTAWWISTIPGITIVITVLGIKFLSDGLSSALDPRTRR